MAVTGNPKLAENSGSVAAFTTPSASYASGTRIVVICNATENDHSDGFSWAISDSASTNTVTWTARGTSALDTAGGVGFTVQSQVWISSELTATESFTITIDPNDGSSDVFLAGVLVVELSGNDGTLSQAAAFQGDGAEPGTVTLGSAPSGYQILGSFAQTDGGDLGSFDAAPTNFADLSGMEELTINVAVNGAESSTNTTAAVTHGATAGSATIFNWHLVLLEFAEADTVAVAEVATSAADAYTPRPTVQVVGGAATSAADAQTPAAGVTPSAEVATAAGDAQGPATSVAAGAEPATSTTVALDATVATSGATTASAEVATSAADALGAVPGVSAGSEAATAAGDAQSVSGSIAGGAEPATATTVSLDAVAGVAAGAEAATTAAAALDAVAVTPGATVATAEVATSAADAYQPGTGATVTAETATATTVSLDAASSVAAAAEAATAATVAADTTSAVDATAEPATSTTVALDATTASTVAGEATAELATTVAAAYDATVATVDGQADGLSFVGMMHRIRADAREATLLAARPARVCPISAHRMEPDPDGGMRCPFDGYHER